LDHRCAAAFAAIYACINYLQWRDLQRNFRLERRAWIKIAEDAPTALKPGELLHSQVTITNTGATPADDVRGNIIVTLLAKDESLDVAYSEGHPQFYVSLGSLPAGTSESSTIPGSRPSLDQTGPAGILINQETIDRVKSGGLRLVTYGLLAYSDIFGVPHWLTSAAKESRITGMVASTVAQPTIAPTRTRGTGFADLAPLKPQSEFPFPLDSLHWPNDGHTHFGDWSHR
jgi:hypothetical protein